MLTSTPTPLTTLSTTPSSECAERGLIDIVLVHADADGLGIDLDQFGQRVLRAAGNRDCAADGDVEVGELGAGEGGGGVDRCACFVDDQVLYGWGAFVGPYQLGGQFLGLARGSAVADGDERDVVAVDHVLQGVDRAHPIVLRLVRIDRAGVEQFAGGVDHGDLAAGAEARVETEHGVTRQRRLREQRAQVGGEDLNGMDLRLRLFHDAHRARWRAATGVRRNLEWRVQLIGKRADDVLLEFGLNRVEPIAFGSICTRKTPSFSPRVIARTWCG